MVRCRGNLAAWTLILAVTRDQIRAETGYEHDFSSTTVTSTDMAIELKSPMRLEKKKNINNLARCSEPFSRCVPQDHDPIQLNRSGPAHDPEKWKSVLGKDLRK